jgi:hypothetical protein
MASYPKDRFDTVPDDLLRVGAHRAPRKKGRGWVTFAWAAVATLVLVLAGVVGLTIIDSQTNLALPSSSTTTSASTSASTSATTSATPTPTVVKPVLDSTISITILNGTTTSGLSNQVGNTLVAKGWTGVGTRANADQHNVATTFVYYKEAAQEAAALAVVRDLGFGQARLSKAFDAPITVVIGADHKPIA